MRDRADRLDRHQNGQVDGLLCWIRLTAEEGGAPLDSLRQRTNCLPVYLPLFDTPVPVTAGDRLAVEFARRTSDDSVHPDYQVHAELGDRSGSFTSTHHGTELGTAAVYRELFGR